MILKERVISHKKDKEGKYLIEVEETHGVLFLWRWFGTKTKITKYYGECTIWREFPSFISCNSYTCLALCDIQKRIEYGEKYGKTDG